MLKCLMEELFMIIQISTDTIESMLQKHLQNTSEIATFFGGTSAFYGIGASKIKD